jgi:hypothetical protein
MTDMSATQATDGVPTYLGKGDPIGRFADYHPAWVDKLAGDVTLEGSMPTAPCTARTPSARSSAASVSCTTARTSTSPAPAATTASSRTTPRQAQPPHGRPHPRRTDSLPLAQVDQLGREVLAPGRSAANQRATGSPARPARMRAVMMWIRGGVAITPRSSGVGSRCRPASGQPKPRRACRRAADPRRSTRRLDR